MPSIRVSPFKCASSEKDEAPTPLNDDDARCLIAIRAVLEMHGKQDRFGVALLHSELTRDGNEVLLVDDEGSGRDRSQPHQTRRSPGTIWKLNEAASSTLKNCQPGRHKGQLEDSHHTDE